jgi:hypothetical protein
MAKTKRSGKAARRETVQAGGGEAVQARVRELVTALAAEIIAETAERLDPARRAMPLAMTRRTRSAPRPRMRG